MSKSQKKNEPKKGKETKGGKEDPNKTKKMPMTDKPEKKEETQKEKMLKAELETITQEVEEAKAKVILLRNDNEWLQEETRKIRLENHEYMAYMEKKTDKRQTAIISLSDHHQQELENLKKEKEVIMADFEKKKQELLDQIMEKENIVAKINREIDELHEYKVLQQEQNATIKDLERELISLRVKHSDAVQQMKTKFLAEKQEYETTAQQKIADTTKQANKEAAVCLNDHTIRVKQQNRQLRKELMLLIRKTQALHEHKHRLEEQRHQLLTERQYATDMKSIRVNRTQKAILAAAGDEDSCNGDASADKK